MARLGAHDKAPFTTKAQMTQSKKSFVIIIFFEEEDHVSERAHKLILTWTAGFATCYDKHAKYKYYIELD